MKAIQRSLKQMMITHRSSPAQIRRKACTGQCNGIFKLPYSGNQYSGYYRCGGNRWSTLLTCGVSIFDVYDCVDSPIVFNGVDITVKRGPCIELSGGSATFTDCDFEVTGEIKPENAWSSCYRNRLRSDRTVVSGGYKGTNYGLYIYSSGSNDDRRRHLEADVALRADGVMIITMTTAMRPI